MKNKIMVNCNKWQAPAPVAATVLLAALLIVPGCDEDTAADNDGGTDTDTDGGTDTDTSFECNEDRDGWEQCVDNKVQWCHVVEGMDPHFHWGADCEALGYECVELTESTAACLDESSSCTVGEFKCEDNTAHNCMDHGDHGHWAIEPCGTAATCEEEADKAHCHAGESDFDTQDACDAIAGTEVEEKAVVTTFSEVFSEDYHADLGVKVHVTLPDDQVSYIHFPVFTCGEFAMFMDTADVFDGIQHRDQSEITVSGGTAVSLCSDDIPEHWHADLEWDGESTKGESPVPYVIRFKAVAGGMEVNFAAFQIAVED